MSSHIPVQIVEEHHEALIVWRDAIGKGLIPARGNSILHVDEHSDLALPKTQTPIQEAFLNDVRELVYRELHIGNFLYAAIYVEIFNRVYWLRQNHENGHRSQILSVLSVDGAGRVLQAIPYENPHRFFDADRKTFRLTYVEPEETLIFPDSPVILDIDLDYFSCDNSAGESWEIEITKDAFLLLGDPMNKLRLIATGYMSVEERDEKYFLIRKAIEKDLRASDSSIRERIETFIHFLERNNVQPVLIDICRSRVSGYTPADQWQLIEQHLLKSLRSLYPIQIPLQS